MVQTGHSPLIATGLSIPVSVPHVRAVLLALVAVLVLAHIAGQFSEHILGKPSLKGFVPRTNMNGEMSLATLVSTLLLAACTLLLAIITLIAHRTGNRFTRWWAGLVLVFAYVTADEAIALHEATIAPLRDQLGVPEGWLFFAWVIPAAILLLAMLVLYRSFLFSVPVATRNQSLLAGLLLAGGALCIELISGWYLSARGDGFTYELIGALEETLELLGIIIFLTALLAHLGRTAGEVRFRITPAPPPRPS
jgi:hypothetical protein